MSVTTEPTATLDHQGAAALVNRGREVVQVASLTEDEVITATGARHALSGATVLPRGGECITTETAAGTVSGRWLGTGGAPETPGLICGWVLEGDGEPREHVFIPGVIDARASVVRQCPHADVAMAAAVLASITARASIGQYHQARMDTLVSDAHQWADDNDLCERFDEFMDEHGLPMRERDFELRVEVATTVYLTRTATTLEGAMQSVDADAVREAINLDDDSYSVEESD